MSKGVRSVLLFAAAVVGLFFGVSVLVERVGWLETISGLPFAPGICGMFHNVFEMRELDVIADLPVYLGDELIKTLFVSAVSFGMVYVISRLIGYWLEYSPSSLLCALERAAKYTVFGLAGFIIASMIYLDTMQGSVWFGLQLPGLSARQSLILLTLVFLVIDFLLCVLSPYAAGGKTLGRAFLKVLVLEPLKTLGLSVLVFLCVGVWGNDDFMHGLLGMLVLLFLVQFIAEWISAIRERSFLGLP